MSKESKMKDESGAPSIARQLTDVRLPVRLKLAALWASVLFLCIYGNYFELCAPGKLPAMLAGRMALGNVSQTGLLGMAAVMALPSQLLVLTLLLPARSIRWLNFGLWLLYTGIILLAIQDSWPSCKFYGGSVVVLTGLITWLAWSWPTQAGTLREAPYAGSSN